jgi:hypothetical protein
MRWSRRVAAALAAPDALDANRLRARDRARDHRSVATSKSRYRLPVLSWTVVVDARVRASSPRAAPLRLVDAQPLAAAVSHRVRAIRRILIAQGSRIYSAARRISSSITTRSRTSISRVVVGGVARARSSSMRGALTPAPRLRWRFGGSFRWLASCGSEPSRLPALSGHLEPSRCASASSCSRVLPQDLRGPGEQHLQSDRRPGGLDRDAVITSADRGSPTGQRVALTGCAAPHRRAVRSARHPFPELHGVDALVVAIELGN